MTTTDQTTAAEQAAATERLLAALDAFDALPEAVALRQRSYDLLDLRPGDAAADIGCGAGRAVAELAERGITASGVEPDAKMISVARQRHPHLDFHLAAAESLPYADGDLRGYRAEKVYHVLADPAAALTEARRALAPGGRIVLIGQDWEAFVIDSDDMPTTRALVTARAATMPSPYAARRYRNHLRDAGYVDAAVEVHTGVFHEHALMAPLLAGLAAAGTETGAVTPEQAGAWLAEQEQRGHTGRFLFAVPIFVASGQRP